MRVFKLLNKLVSVAKTYLNKITVHVSSQKARFLGLNQ